jgi:hypothetical protein
MTGTSRVAGHSTFLISTSGLPCIVVIEPVVCHQKSTIGACQFQYQFQYRAPCCGEILSPASTRGFRRAQFRNVASEKMAPRHGDTTRCAAAEPFLVHCAGSVKSSGDIPNRHCQTGVPTGLGNNCLECRHPWNPAPLNRSTLWGGEILGLVICVTLVSLGGETALEISEGLRRSQHE